MAEAFVPKECRGNCGMEKIFPKHAGDTKRDVKRGLRAALGRVNKAARDINDVALFKHESIEVTAELTPLVTHRLSLSGQRATLLLDFPVLRSHHLKNKDIVIVPMWRKAFPIGRSEVQVGLKPVAQLGSEHPAQQAEVRLPMMQLIQDESATVSHIPENGLHTLRCHALVRFVLLSGSVGKLDVIGGAGNGSFEILKAEQAVIIVGLLPMHDQWLLLPIARSELLLRNRRNKRRQPKVLKKRASHRKRSS